MRFLDNLRARIPAFQGDPGRPNPTGKGLPDLPGAGVYHYLRETTVGKARIHLRLENDGRGLLLVNASRAFHLNPSAACMAYLSLEGHPEETAVKALVRRFRVSRTAARRDYQAFTGQLEIMTNPDEHCPVLSSGCGRGRAL